MRFPFESIVGVCLSVRDIEIAIESSAIMMRTSIISKINFIIICKTQSQITIKI